MSDDDDDDVEALLGEGRRPYDCSPLEQRWLACMCRGYWGVAAVVMLVLGGAMAASAVMAVMISRYSRSLDFWDCFSALLLVLFGASCALTVAYAVHQRQQYERDERLMGEQISVLRTLASNN